MKKQYYFESEDSEMCYTLDYFTDSVDPTVNEITLLKAEKDNTTDAIWCKAVDSTGEKGECGIICPLYDPRNGKSGMCKHQGQLFSHGDPVTIKIPAV